MLNLNDPGFTGPYAELYRQFIAYKRAMGYEYGESVVYGLRKMNRDIEAMRTSEEGPLPQSLALAWAEKAPGESRENRKRRMIVMRQFGLFVEGVGIECFVLPKRLMPAKASKFEPYVFTEEEVARLMAYFDSLPGDKRFRSRSLVMPALFRTIYGCGLRLREASDLKVWEVDIAGGVISVNGAKGGKNRYVPMSGSLAAEISAYWEAMGFDGADPDQPFFPSPKKNGFYTSPSIRLNLKNACNALGIANEKGQAPRVHDLRHTFACHALDKVAKEGGDPYAALPVLAEYLGHSHISDTERYLHLTEAGRRLVIEKTRESAERVFPKGGPRDER